MAGNSRQPTKSGSDDTKAHSNSSNRIIIPSSTKEGHKIISAEPQPKLWAYMAGIARNQGFEAMIIGGGKDHVHALLLLPPSLPLSKAIQVLKGNSSKWLNETGAAGNKFSWQEGYGAFSVSASQTADVIRYIENQVAHHAHKSFEEEFVEFLTKYGVAYDPAHVLG